MAIAENIRIIQVGLGPLGRMMSGYLAERSGYRVVGMVDRDPSLVGKTLGDVGGGVTIRETLSEALEESPADIAVVTTVSDLERIVGQVEDAVGNGLHVVSTCEELVYPWRTRPELAQAIHRAAKAAGVTVLSTGVNPGFLMDALPLVLSGISRRVESVRVCRIQDASHRRLPFRQKIGAGLSVGAFEEKRRSGSLRHVGLTESMHMIADGLGWSLDETRDDLSPVVADHDIDLPGTPVRKGQAAGVQQVGRGYVGGEEKITLLFRASVGEAAPEDTVTIAGDPGITSTIAAGVNGDVATCSIVANAVAAVLDAPSGLRTMRDMPPVTCRGSRC